MPTVIPLAELASHVGETFGSATVEVTQEMVDRFAEATGDHQGSTSTPSAPLPDRSAPPSPTAT